MSMEFRTAKGTAMQNSMNGASISIWHATATALQFPPMAGNTAAEICVIGAGIAGLTTAYLLAKEGRKVIVIDAAGVGSGETGRTTAHFFPPDEWYAGIEESFGAARTALVADSFASAIGWPNRSFWPRRSIADSSGSMVTSMLCPGMDSRTSAKSSMPPHAPA
jgi:hypothetical protein